MSWFFSLMIIAMLLAFNVFALDAITKMRRDVAEILKALSDTKTQPQPQLLQLQPPAPAPAPPNEQPQQPQQPVGAVEDDGQAEAEGDVTGDASPPPPEKKQPKHRDSPWRVAPSVSGIFM